jgi:hypothetical protein
MAYYFFFAHRWYSGPQMTVDDNSSTNPDNTIRASVPLQDVYGYTSENLSRRINFAFCISQVHVHGTCYIPRMFQVPSTTLENLGKLRLSRSGHYLAFGCIFNAMVCAFTSIRMEYTRDFLG